MADKKSSDKSEETTTKTAAPEDDAPLTGVGVTMAAVTPAASDESKMTTLDKELIGLRLPNNAFTPTRVVEATKGSTVSKDLVARVEANNKRVQEEADKRRKAAEEAAEEAPDEK